MGWVAQHHAPLGGGGLSSPWTFLAHAAARTRRIRLSTAITVLPLENPVRLAEDISVVERPWADAYLAAWDQPRIPRIGLSRFVFPAKDTRTALDQIAADDAAPGPVLAALRASLDGKARRYRQLLDRLETAEDPAPAAPGTSDYEAALHARRAVIDAQREELLRWRDAGHLPDASLRILEGELDHEERTLPPHDAH